MRNTFQPFYFIHSLRQKKALLKSRAKGLVMNSQITYQITSINRSILCCLNSLHLMHPTWIKDKYTPIKIPYCLE